MPNWCSNTLIVRGASADVAAFVEKAKGPTHRYIGPFNRDWTNKEADTFDWGGFTPLMMEVLMDNPDTFIGGQEEHLSFHALYPVPKEILLSPYDGNRLKEATQKYPEWFNRFPNLIAGYDWENRHWGTKWGASGVILNGVQEVGNGESEACYEFDTAWSPPTDFVHKIAGDFPALTFELTYSEEGMGFAGEVTWSDGECVSTDEYDIYEEEDEENGGEE